MRLEIKTVYENVDGPWLHWYLKRLANEQVLPGSTAIARELGKNKTAKFSSKDPDSNVTATTYYDIVSSGTTATHGASDDK